MDRITANKFSILVNSPGGASALSEYADHRIAKLTKDLLSAQTWEDVRGLQKAIEELTRLKTLRDEVNNPTGE